MSANAVMKIISR